METENGSTENVSPGQASALQRRGSATSAASDGSQTAAEFLQEQMQLEADAREALPYVRHFARRSPDELK